MISMLVTLIVTLTPITIESWPLATWALKTITHHLNKIQKIAVGWRLRDIIFGWHHLNWYAFIIDNTSEKAVENGWEKTRKPWSPTEHWVSNYHSRYFKESWQPPVFLGDVPLLISFKQFLVHLSDQELKKGTAKGSSINTLLSLKFHHQLLFETFGVMLHPFVERNSPWP